MMAVFKVFPVCCLCLAFANAQNAFPSSDCYDENCESDDTQLLQASQGRSSERGFPDLGDAFKKASGALSKLGNVAEKGVEAITTKVESVLDDVDGQLGKVETACNNSFKAFDKAASANGTMSENITKLQGLVNGTMGDFLKLFASFNDKLTGAIDTASSSLKLAGQADLADELNTSVSAAVGKLRSVSDAGKAVVSNTAEASAEKASEQIPKVKAAIQSLSGKASEFATQLVDSFRKTSDQLLEFAKSKLPKEGQKALGKPLAKMIEKAQATAEKFKKAVEITSGELGRSADTVAQTLSSPGFFGHVKDFFSHLFR